MDPLPLPSLAHAPAGSPPAFSFPLEPACTVPSQLCATSSTCRSPLSRCPPCLFVTRRRHPAAPLSTDLPPSVLQVPLLPVASAQLQALARPEPPLCYSQMCRDAFLAADQSSAPLTWQWRLEARSDWPSSCCRAHCLSLSRSRSSPSPLLPPPPFSSWRPGQLALVPHSWLLLPHSLLIPPH